MCGGPPRYLCWLFFFFFLKNEQEQGSYKTIRKKNRIAVSIAAAQGFAAAVFILSLMVILLPGSGLPGRPRQAAAVSRERLMRLVGLGVGYLT